MLRAIRIVEGTKISHDEFLKGEHFALPELLKRNIPAIGIPASVNNLLIVDIDSGGKAHKFDGREAWAKFATEAGIPETYTVRTGTGGFHFYFKLPEHLNKQTFSPRKNIFPGVDIVYNGYVLAPPSKGYVALRGSLDDIAEAPVSLLREVVSRPTAVDDLVGNLDEEVNLLDLHRPLSEAQIERLKKQLEWMQVNVGLTYHQWYRGLVSLKAGIPDEETLELLALLWTRNQNWSEGDDEKALSILRKTDRFGGVGPGTIFELIKEVGGEHGETLPTYMLSKKDIIERSGVTVSIGKDGLPKVNPNESNIAAIIDQLPQFSAANMYHDIRLDTYIYDGEQVDDSYLVDIITPALQSAKEGLGFENFKKNTIKGALEILMTKRRRDPHAEWCNSLKWDGVSRVENFFSRYVMVDDSPYARRVSLNFWVGLAARSLNPGCKVDNLVIIEGREGIKKSSLLEAIGGDYYYALATDEKLNDLDVLRRCHQSLIVELPEIVALLNQGGDAIKAITTVARDKIRSLYAKKAYDRKRGFIFAGTTNLGDGYINSSMGERRYYPVKIRHDVDGIDIVGVKADRAQLFAEAVHLYNKGFPFWDMPKDIQHAEIEIRQTRDPLCEVVQDVVEGGILANFKSHWSVHEIYEVLYRRELLTRGLTKKTSDRIEAILRALNFTRIKGKGGYVWTRPSAINIDELI